MLARLFQKSPCRGTPPLEDHLPVLEARALLAAHQLLAASIRSLVGVPDAHWDRLYRPMLEAFAGFVQQLPASEVHHHAGPGGLLRHALEVALEAMKLRRGTLLPPGASAEELARLQDVWSYACVSAALLHDIGKPLADHSVMLFGTDLAPLGPWAPVNGPMPPAARYYRVEFVARRRYRRHERLAPLLANHIVPAEGLCWLAGEPETLDAWLTTLQGDYEEAGPLGAIVAKADGLSVARDLSGGGKVQLPTARTRPLAERLLTGLRHLLAQEELPLNRRGAAGFLAGNDLWLVSKRVLDALREELAREGQTGIPSRNDRLMDELQQHGLLIPNDDRAIWTCEVHVGDWAQRLTFLRMEASTVWSDPARRPAPFEGVVQPVADAVVEQTVLAVDEGEAMTGTAQGTGLPPGDEGTDDSCPATAPGGFDDLPLPYDMEAGPESHPAVPEGGQTRSPQAPPLPGKPGEGDADAGRRFLAWIKDNIASGRAEINTANARLHVISEGLALVTPGIFRDFDPAHWQNAQKRFQKLKLHRKTPDDTNVWTCVVAKSRKRSLIKVFLIPDPASALGGVKLPPPNAAVSLLTDATGADQQEATDDGQAV